MIRLNAAEWRIFRHLQRKHKVSKEFLRYNIQNIQKIIYYETWPRIVLKRYAIRKRNRVFLIRNRLRRLLFDQANRKTFYRFRQNIRQWSKRIVAYRRRTIGTEEYVEEIVCGRTNTTSAVSKENASPAEGDGSNPQNVEDVSEQLKKQLELLKSGRRQLPFIERLNTSASDKPCAKRQGTSDVIGNENSVAEDVTHLETETVNPQKSDKNLEKIRNIIQDSIRINNANKESSQSPALDEDNHVTANPNWQEQLENTPEKQIIGNEENVQPIKQLATDEKTEKSQNDENHNPEATEKVKTGLNFLDMLMCKVTANQSDGCRPDAIKLKTSNEKCLSTDTAYEYHEHSLDSTDEFLGFEEGERLPGMLLTPIVPLSGGGNKNSIFVSETLNEYMRANDLETDYNIDEDKAITRTKITRTTDLEGLMTLKSQPPPFDMPAVPDNLLRFRTVAERKNYLSKFSKNYRLSIINNEANIYRELQKRMRYQKTKHTSQLVAQSANSSMSFTRFGWQTASFINTEFNKYYYQMLDVDGGKHVVRLKGVRGNNEELRKKPHFNAIVKKQLKSCPPHCIDLDLWQDFKPIQTVSAKTKKLNKESLPYVFKPCPLSHKVLQKPLDDDAAALLLAGGSMAVVRMPTVELEVFPEFGRPLSEIAKRYLQYILPHHDISREWAEFSVSTLRRPGSLKEAVQAAADSIPRKSFTFLIPYLNDRNHILVRRVVDRSEKLDQSFENSLDTELVPKTDFTFRQNLDKSDVVLLECADIVSDMINTVAISCSENSFIKTDPDMQNEDSTCESSAPLSPTKAYRPPSAGANFPPAKKPTKQKRVLLELKRLNATIIDAAVKPEEDKAPCTKEYCAMGCICSSLAEESRLREHCGKAKCILECSCKTSNQSRIMRLETDGRTITTEDAFMLRRKATARLARMEKEFTSTVVLTENETLLINETNNDKKRRCTKLPKRYEYLDDSEDEARTTSPKKTALTTIDNEKNLAVEIKEIREPIYIKDSILEQMKHCTVSLVKLEDVDNVAPWCMIHHLYKCFCKGRALEGKPMIIEKDENNTTIEHAEEEQSEVVDYKSSNAKAKYTFEKVENGKRKYVDEDDDQSEDDNTPLVANKSSEKLEKRRKRVSQEETKSEEEAVSQVRATTPDVKRQEKDKPKRNLEDVRERFYASRPECCRRQIPIPRRMFLYCNRKRRLNILKFIKTNETEHTRLLLNEHVMRSVYYHKIDSEKLQKRKEAISGGGGDAKKPMERQDEKETENTRANRKESPLLPEIVDLSDDKDDLRKLPGQEQIPSNTNNLTATMSTQEDSANMQVQCASNEGVITIKKIGTLSGFEMGSRNNSPAPPASDELKLPKISNCFSLNAKANMQYPLKTTTPTLPLKQNNLPPQHIADFTSAASVYSNVFNPSRAKLNAQPQMHDTSDALSTSTGSPLPSPIDSDNVRDVYNNVIRTMNSLVSKKMQDVDFALRRDSHIIPTPNADILCMMKWSNFLEAFCQGFAYIWQVKSREGTYLVATVRNMLPMITDAMGVVNITALKPERLPLMGKMLLQNVRNEHTTKLAIVMQGRQSYWIVKGFLKAEPTTACNKPTPETHPSLTKKINVLCTSLVKQRQKDEKNKEMLAQRWSANSSKSTKVAQIIPTPRIQPVVEQQIQPPAPPAVPQLPPPPPYSASVQQTKPSSLNVTCQVNTSSLSAPPPPATQNTTTQNSRKRKSTNDAVSAAIIGSSCKMDTYAKMSTNIEFRKVTHDDMDEIHLPEVHKSNHKWLVLDLHNDFSHIFVPDFRDLVSLDRIQKVINFARQKNKIVKLQFFQNAPFDAFVTPKSGRKIYFGPLEMKMKPPTLILLQSVDGQMMLRELYRLKHNIQNAPNEVTKAFWLFQMNGQTHFEIDMEAPLPPPPPYPQEEKNQTQDTNSEIQTNAKHIEHVDDDDDDEDCMIVEEIADKGQATPSEGRYNFTIASQANDNAISVVPQSNSLPGPLPIHTLVNTSSSMCSTTLTSAEMASSISCVQTIPHTNTVIKPVLPLVKPTNTLMALPTNTLITGIPTTMATHNTTIANSSLVNLPPNAVITSITPAPQEAPYSSTIIISSSTDENNLMPVTHAMDVGTGKNAPLPTEIITLSDDPPAAPIQREDENSLKRRRVSLVCNNPGFDISNSQNIAVSAVINKLLPENIQDIQVNHSESGSRNITTSSIGSTTITKVSERKTYQKQQQQKQQPTDVAINGETTPIKPVVFDVSFVDGMDEPAASIVIKPTTPKKPTTGNLAAKASPLLPPPVSVNSSVTYSSSAAVSSTVNISTMTVAKPLSTTGNANTIFVGNAGIVSTTTEANPPSPAVNAATNPNIPKINIRNANNRPIGYKVVRIPAAQMQNLNKTPKMNSLPSAISVMGGGATQQMSLATKTVLNTVNPIKITPITPSPTTKATIKPVQNITTSITITPLPTATAAITSKADMQKNEAVKMLSPANLKSRCVTIRQILPKPTAAEVLPTAQKKQQFSAHTFKPQNLAISAETRNTTNLSSSSTTTSALTHASNNYSTAVYSSAATNTTTTTTTPSTSNNTTLNTLNPPLAITSVQTLGATSAQHMQRVEEKLAANSGLPSHIQYGYIVSPLYSDLKFVAKRVLEEFYVKVPSVGILKLMGLTSVNNYLNKHMLKSSDKNTTPGNWQFVAASKAIQMQNHQKSLMVRKTQTTRLNNTKSDSMKSQKVVNPTSISEPILIDD